MAEAYRLDQAVASPPHTEQDPALIALAAADTAVDAVPITGRASR
jgi:hypothetical protein